MADSTATSRTASPGTPSKPFSDEKNAEASSSNVNQPRVATAPTEKAKGFTVDTVAVDDVSAATSHRGGCWTGESELGEV